MSHPLTDKPSYKITVYPRYHHIKLPLWIGGTLLGLVLGGAAGPSLLPASADWQPLVVVTSIVLPILFGASGATAGVLLAQSYRNARTLTMRFAKGRALLNDPDGRELENCPLGEVHAQEGYYERRGNEDLVAFYVMEVRLNQTRLALTANSAAVLSESVDELPRIPVTHAVTDHDYTVLRSQLLPQRAELNRELERAIRSIGSGDTAPFV